MEETPVSEQELALLKEKARQIRISIIKMLAEAGSGHPGGSLSAADIMSVLYFRVMNHDPKNPLKADRDRFILSKGHAAPVLYATLAESGYFDKGELQNLRKLGSFLRGHPLTDLEHGIEATTGSLGQGLSFAVGAALGLKMDGSASRVFCVMGDGETQSGQIWEAAMSAAHYKADNLIGILDRNRLQIDGDTEAVMGLDPVADKWTAFGWNVVEVNGHDVAALCAAFDKPAVPGKPTLILADTVKGKGVSFMEGKASFHGVAPSADEEKQAMAELGGDA
jgi:transketolase